MIEIRLRKRNSQGHPTDEFEKTIIVAQPSDKGRELPRHGVITSMGQAIRTIERNVGKGSKSVANARIAAFFGETLEQVELNSAMDELASL